jgi:hypothetical protein
LLALTIERDVLQWVLGDRAEPIVPIHGAGCQHAEGEPHTE